MLSEPSAWLCCTAANIALTSICGVSAARCVGKSSEHESEQHNRRGNCERGQEHAETAREQAPQNMPKIAEQRTNGPGSVELPRTMKSRMSEPARKLIRFSRGVMSSTLFCSLFAIAVPRLVVTCCANAATWSAVCAAKLSTLALCRSASNS